MNELRPGQLRILKAVASLLEDPSNKITIARIAQENGVTEAAIYRHYRSKEEIFMSLMAYMEANFLGPLNTIQQETQKTGERLERLYVTYMEFLEGHPGLARLFLGHGANEAPGLAERVKLLNAKVRAQIAQMLRFGQAQEALAKDFNPEQGAEVLYGLIVAAAMAQAYSFPQIENDERWAIFAKTILKPEAWAA